MKVLLASFILLLGALGGMAQPPREKEATSHLGKAVRLMQDRLYSDAAAEFEQALAAQPDNDEIRIQYATCLFAQERNEDARKQFEIERRRLGDQPGLSYFLGRLALRAGDDSSAIRHLSPLQSNPAFSKASLYLGLAYLSAGETSRAMESLERAVQKNPRDPEVHYRLARAYSIAGRTDDANREYNSYREWRENQRVTQQSEAECRSALRQPDLAQARGVCQLLWDSNDPRRLLLLGQLYTENGAYRDALDPLLRAVELDSASFEAWQYLGLSLFRLKRYQEALKPLRQAVSLNPQYFNSLVLLASTLHALGDDAAALPILERAHDLNPEDRQVASVLEQLRAKLKQK